MDITVHDPLDHCCLLDGCNCSDPSSGKVFVCCVDSIVGDTNACIRPGGCQNEEFNCKHEFCYHCIENILYQ